MKARCAHRELTGGFLIRNTNDFEVGLQRIDEDIRAYYILSYRRLIWNLTASSVSFEST